MTETNVFNKEIFLHVDKVSNTFRSLFSNNMLLFRTGIHKMDIRIACFFRSSLIWVCTVCLDSFGRFEILEHLPHICSMVEIFLQADKVSNTFHSLFSNNMLLFRAGSLNGFQNSKQGRP